MSPTAITAIMHWLVNAYYVFVKEAAVATITNLNPGNVVVPLSSIIDRLRGKLSSADIDNLLAALLANRKSQVLPGDLITADLINQILQDIQDLNTQVAQLAGGTTSSTTNSQAVGAFTDAWKAYGTLVKNGEFLPTDVSADAIKSTAEITAFLQDVMYAALSGSTLAYSGATNAILDGFTQIYARQHDVVVLFSAPIAGISDTTNQAAFATLLNIGLEQDTALGEISLKKAIDNQNLPSAIAAQNRINAMVQNQGGDVTTGNLEVTYRGAVGTTETLVIGSTTPVLYRFNIANKTNRNLDAQLKAEFLPPRQDWTQLSIVDTNGAAVSDIQFSAFDPTKPTDPSSNQEVRVSVMTPSGAADGDSGVLQLTASVPDPINRKASASRQLFVAKSATTQTPGIVAFSTGTPIISGDLSNATEKIPITLAFEFNFSALQGPSSRNFRFRLDITAPTNPDSLFFIQFAPAEAAIDGSVSTPTKKVSQQFSMTDGSKRTVTVSVTPLTGSKNNSLSFTATVESATDGITATSQAFTMAVKN
jgi:hypothetical protein